jgi:hypothetical protein
MLRLDSTGQKGPEIPLEGVLIVVEGCFTAEINGSDLTKTHTTLAPAFLHISCKLLSSSLVVFTATVCLVYGSGSVGTEVFVVVQLNSHRA